MRQHRVRVVLPAALALALGAAACGGSSGTNASTTPTNGTSPSGGASPTSNANVSGTVAFTGVWTGDEQKSFQAVLDGFKKQYPNVTVNYQAAGDQLPTVLSTAIAGGNPPDLADVAQPGLVKDFVGKKALQPLDFANSEITSNFPSTFVDLGKVDGTLYGLIFKTANKSAVWYNTHVYTSAGVTPAKTWDDLLKDAKTIKASGVPAYSIGGADGWTLTDLFENIYLRTAGPEMYAKLSSHQIPWTDASVKTALTDMAKIIGDTGNIAGGTAGALQTDFPSSVTQVFATPPKAAEIFEGDFVAGTITGSTKAKPKTDFDEFAFPSINGSKPAVVGGGDTIVMFKSTPASQALVKYLATADAAKLWASRGGFSSANVNLDPSVYPDQISRDLAQAVVDAAKAGNFAFDMSDQQPSSFGATVGQGEWKIFQDFLRNPSNVDGTASQLETAAAAAYKAGK